VEADATALRAVAAAMSPLTGKVGRMTGPASQIGRWWYTLDEFCDRAERVLGSEIARRQDLATVGITVRLIASVVDGAFRYAMEREVPREADVESAAARVRPLFLQDDPVFHGKVTKAIGGLAHPPARSTKSPSRP
jgi:hypothetical protein